MKVAADRSSRPVPLLSVEDVHKSIGPGAVLSGLNFGMEPGQTLGVLGESGSGKTMLAGLLARLVPASSGRIVLAGRNLVRMSERRVRRQRRHLQILFSDPAAMLDGARTVRDLVDEPLEVHRIHTGVTRERQIVRLLDQVGLPEAVLWRRGGDLPPSFWQRIALARAIAVAPKLIVADEPFGRFGPTAQAQLMNLLRDLQERHGFGLIVLSRDPRLIEFLCDQVLVLASGRIVERGPTRTVFDRPSHPYTQAMLAYGASPAMRLPYVDAPAPEALPSGCVFRLRCAGTQRRCETVRPRSRPLGGGHAVACHAVEIDDGIEPPPLETQGETVTPGRAYRRPTPIG